MEIQVAAEVKVQVLLRYDITIRTSSTYCRVFPANMDCEMDYFVNYVTELQDYMMIQNYGFRAETISTSPDFMVHSDGEVDLYTSNNELTPISYMENNDCEIVRYIQAPLDGSGSTSPGFMEDSTEEDSDTSDDELPPLHYDLEDDDILYDVSSLNVDDWIEECCGEDHETASKDTNCAEGPIGGERHRSKWSCGWLSRGLRRFTNSLFSCHRGQREEE
ncbi:uncharacterized protein LOC142652513 [Rhinoderma darwinii]|uniref:uncharacterized protein LOC142652513 n=1 Tax=Rhinoderma darwinii TaxID=43563 RepID=UPI003F66D0FA